MGKCLVSTADICPVSTADISISIDHSASAFRINNQHIMEAATAADVTQASEMAGRYITLGIPSHFELTAAGQGPDIITASSCLALTNAVNA